MKNVIYIIADQMRWDALACNGAEFMKTPNFDRLAREGVNFSCTYSGNPVCVPARGILATGCWSHICMDPEALNGNGGRIMPEHIHIARLLKQQGYGTYGIGKCHAIPYKINHGFDVFEVAEEGRLEMGRHNGTVPEDAVEDYIEYLKCEGYEGMQRAHGIGNNDARAGAAPLPEEHYVDTWATTRSLECLDQHLKSQRGNPFYLQLGFVKPHAPYDPPAPYDRMYDPREIPPPWGSEADLEGRNPAMKSFPDQYLLNRMSPMAVLYSRAHYFGLVSFLDKQVGRILDWLDQNNLADETIVVFTSDHGDNIGDHGLFFKTFFTEGAARIPFLLRAPGLDSNEVPCPVGQEDVMPTICDLLGVNIPNEVNGESLVKLANGTGGKERQYAVSQHLSGNDMTLMIRDEQYKYCFARYGATEELYDMKNDPHELNNLSKEPAMKDKLMAMRHLAQDWCMESGHEPLMKDSGELWASEYNHEKMTRLPHEVMGIRPW
jgi:arylsulfatase A-like enzyme